MASFGIMDTFFVYQFIKRLVKPFDRWPAYKTGVIDKDGNILISDDQRSDIQKKSFKYFDLLVMNVKKVLAKIPGGSSKIATYAAALWLLHERTSSIEANFETLEESILEYIKEEIANTANPANIAGLDNPPKFMGHRVFNVKRSTLDKIKHGKKLKDRYKKYLDEEENWDDIRQYCRNNPKESIILNHNGEMMFLRRKSQKLTESIQVSSLKTVESYLNSLYSKIGIGFNFSNHFGDRIHDPRNNPPINYQEVLNYFGRFYMKYQNMIKNMKNEEEILVSDPKTNIFTPVVMKQGSRNRFLRVMTIMRKRNYQSDNFDNKKVVL